MLLQRDCSKGVGRERTVRRQKDFKKNTRYEKDGGYSM